MFKREKVVEVGTLSDFLAQKKQSVEVKKLYPAAALSASVMMLVTEAHAAGGYVEGKVKERIIDAFQPIIEIVQAAAYPVGIVMMGLGCLIIITGNQPKGMQMIKRAAYGFLLIQFIPAIMEILGGVASAMRQ